jgi:superfamily I DNA/RNA helicase
MTGGFGTLGLEVRYTRRFLDDAGRLPKILVRKVDEAVAKIRAHGIYQSGLLAERVNGNPDGRFRFLRVDLQYRMVAVAEGRDVLLMKVGNHDETERWGETATLGEYEERISAADVELGGLGRTRRETAPALLETTMSLGEIVSSPVMSEEIAVCLDGVLEGWADGTIEDWMIFLSPVQRRAVVRAVGGPGRVTGGPGTGKTVVALHRAVEFARRAGPGQKVLLTSFVNTVPAVLKGLFERLAPDLADRVECRTVHSLAVRHLDAHGPHATIDAQGQQARARFTRSLHAKPERFRQLRFGARLTEEYLYEEVTRVIQGRGVPDRAAYLTLQRYGRKRQLPALLRSLIWDVYEEYRAACANPDEPILTWDEVLADALIAVREAPPTERYAAIVVDEAQDITEVGLRFLLELLEGGLAGRILVVGDAGQRIYPGGWRLADLGLEIRGRSFALSVCYRSTDEIMQAVGALGRFLSPEEFGEDGLRSLATSTVRTGPLPVMRGFGTEHDEAAWILSQLDADDPGIDGTGILAFSKRDVEKWHGLLADAGLGSVRLEDYHGRPVPGVKVGTYHRAKGLEFGRVFLPGLDASFPYGDRGDSDDIIAKGSALYVAMSRARDRLFISYTGSPSMFLGPVAVYCDAEDSDQVVEQRGNT